MRTLASARHVLATLLIALPAIAGASEEITGVASVIDGDTVEIHGTRVRLHGIDAPESAQLCVDADDKQWRCGQRASFALADLERCSLRPGNVHIVGTEFGSHLGNVGSYSLHFPFPRRGAPG